MKNWLAGSLTFALILSGCAQMLVAQRIGGTLVVAVPVSTGLVVCSDKRLYNESTRTFRDDFVKLHRVNGSTLFVATHTTGFYDATSRKMAFDVFDLTANYVAQHVFTPGRPFWNGLGRAIRQGLLSYLSKRRFADWPETDAANNRLLFNLVFFSVNENTARSYSMSVFYEKAPTPVIYIPDVTSEEVKTPKLLGKGKDVIAYLARDPALSSDPSLLRFDQFNFQPAKTDVAAAVDFAKRLIQLTNAKLPDAEVSKNYDCALLDRVKGFQWINETGG